MEENKTITRYYVDFPNPQGVSEEDTFRLTYGFDPEDAEEHGIGYYMTITEKRTGKTILQRGFSDSLEGGDMLILIEKWVPDSLPKEEVTLLEEHKGLIAAGLPI